MLGIITITVGQRDSEDVNERDPDKEMAANSAVAQDIAKEGREEVPEIIEQMPSPESNLEELAQPTECQSNDVGFKKVFKFVGFKFTVKKDKSEKSDTVQLLTVRKEEGEGAGGSDGAGDHQEPRPEPGEATPKESELKQSTEKPDETTKHEQSSTDTSLPAESGQAAEEGRDGEEKQEKEPAKSPDSPTSPVASETASPFKKFFTQGWAGWRKKTSFRKPKEEELEASEKKKEQEPERADAEGHEKMEETSEKLAASAQPQPQGATESASDARLSAEYEKVELPSEGQVQGSPEEKPAPLATEIFDEKVEIVAEVHVRTTEKETEEPKAEAEELEESLPSEKRAETNAEPREAEPPEEPAKAPEAGAPEGDHTRPPEPGPDDKPSSHPEGIVSEAEMLASQERVKVQGSPLKKLFTSTGLKKLSGKKQKVKRGGGGGDEESGEHHAAVADSADSADEQKGESSASSPEEPEEITCLEKGLADAQQDGEVEEGTTSDGEKKREGVTPWASFKKMVTPKKRVRRLSESDKEDELEKVKSATLSSTESTASEMHEEGKGHGEEPKPEEPKRRVDTSVSWEALICVGSSKKRARKASSSDEEGAPKPTAGESQKPDDGGRDREAGADTVPAASQEHDQGQGSSSPEPAGSPSEGEGVSTWESFKRLVTSRKKSKSKLEEKTDDSVTGAGLEHSAADVETGKEESWVSIKKFIPGRRKKRSDGKQDQTAAEDTGPPEVHEDDADVPAVVPLSEYDAVEREKMEAQGAQGSEEKPEQRGAAVYVSEELSKSLVHTVAVAVVDGARAVADIEERSPSWISASVTEPLERSEDEDKPPSGEVLEREAAAEESPLAAKALPESRDASDDTIVSEMELTSEAVTAAETTGAFCAEEATEASGAEETTDMVSAVSQLTDSPDTTEEATPVQEVEGGVPDTEDQDRRTQEVLQAVARKVREESQLPGATGPEDTVQTTWKGESEIPEEEEGGEEESQVPGLKKEMDVVLKGHVEETDTENLTQGKANAQATPERFRRVPQVTEGVESSELITTCPAATLLGIKSEIPLEQAAAPDSAGTLTDSETNGSTPVADSEALQITQQDRVVDIHASGEVASGTGSQVMEAEAVPALKETPPAPSGVPSQEERRERVLEHVDEEVSVETVPILSKTVVIQEASQLADDEIKDVPFVVEGLGGSADTEITASRKKVREVVPQGEVTEEAEFQENDSIERQSHTQFLPTPEGGEVVVQVEREEMEAKPAPEGEEKLEPKPVEVHSQQLVQTVHVTIVDGEKEVISCEESSFWLVEKEAVCTEIQVQSSETSLPLTVATVEEKVLGETVKILETPGTLEPAEAHLEEAEESSEKEDFIVQPGEDAVPTGNESQAESVPVIVPAAPEKGISADPEADETPSRKGRSGEDHEQVICQEVRVNETEDLKAEKEILQLTTESRKLVQNVIQTAVDRLASTEDTATDGQTPALLIQADDLEAEQSIEKEEREPQVSAEGETQTTTAKEGSALTAAEHTCSDVSKDVNAAPQEVMTLEVEGSRVSDQQLAEVILLTREKREAPGTRSVREDGDRGGLGERTEKPRSESQEDENGDAADYPENHTSALEDTEASGALTKESADANGPKLKEKEVEFQDGNGQSESETEIETHTQEETQKPERQPAAPELTES
ncbi:A-kinase anchoring protein 12 [Phyllostomus discolor]|uniref:A-kinase anchor protein 12 isoform X2 n=1 Tax=Phyllostomus discolor TaxID=89673 RepID=A0A7E6DNP3_9CHIR|nr:A-kinase anchor protein 12 isoform X2 [Phyllostomus discolor]KAF6112636.1 A-kinase anchoring protein 12 [Phyllostomus discolor]